MDRLDVDTSYSQAGNIRIFLLYTFQFNDPDDLGMPRQLLKKGLNDPKVQEYFKLMVEIAELFGASRSHTEQELEASLEFEIELAKVSLSPHPFYRVH